MQFGISMFEEIRNHIGTMPGGMLGLEHEACIFLISLSRETYVVELNFVHSRLGSFLCQGNIVFLNLRLRGIGPYQLPVFAPWLASFVGLHRQFGMCNHQAFVTKDGHSRNRVHTLRMQEMGELRQVVNRDMMPASQRVIEWNVDAAVAIFYIEDHRIPAQLTP